MLQTQAMCRPSSQRNTTKMKSSKANFVNLNFSPSTKKKTSIPLNVFFSINVLFKGYDGQDMRFPAKKHAGCPKAPCDFPPRKDGILLPPIGLPWDSLPPPPESVPTDGRMDAGVKTNIFHIDRLRALEFRYYQNMVYQNEPLLKQITSVSSPFSSPFVCAVSPLCECLEQTKTNSKVSFFSLSVLLLQQ